MSLVVRVIAPTGRDAELIVNVLKANAIAAETTQLEFILAHTAAAEPIGPLLIAEEALSPSMIDGLASALAGQPPWSDLPLLIVTRAGRETAQSRRIEEALLPLGSPILLERPIRTATLVSSIRAALRSRQRQYESRDLFSERNAALLELQYERELLGAVLDNVPVGVVLTKPSGEVLLANWSVEHILRAPVLRTHDAAAPALFSDPRYPLARAIVSGQSVAPEDLLYDRADGTQGWISIAASPIREPDGTVVGAVAAIVDIDRQKQAETALIRNEKLAAVGRLAASISHEINNPLEAVTNLLYLALQSSGLPADVSEYLKMADGELHRVSQIVMQTLRFHRQATSPRPITPEALLDPAIGLYRGRMANSQITLDLQHRPASDLVCYEGDIRQVLNNLIGNAIDAMRTGGRLMIRTSRSRIWSTATPGVRFTVADTGHGMSGSTIQKIFEPFYTTKGMNGTGLGLWISKGIVEKHRGKLQVRSSTRTGRQGTVFSMVLPSELPNHPSETPEPHM